MQERRADNRRELLQDHLGGRLISLSQGILRKLACSSMTVHDGVVQLVFQANLQPRILDPKLSDQWTKYAANIYAEAEFLNGFGFMFCYRWTNWRLRPRSWSK